METKLEYGKLGFELARLWKLDGNGGYAYRWKEERASGANMTQTVAAIITVNLHLPRRNQWLRYRQKACRLEWTGMSCPMGNKRETAGAASGSPVQRQSQFFLCDNNRLADSIIMQIAKTNEGERTINTESESVHYMVAIVASSA